MERRDFIQLTGLGALLGGAGVASAQGDDKGGEGKKLTRGFPSVMAPRADGAEVLWRVNGLSKGYVEYGTTEKLGSVQKNDGTGLLPAGEQSLRVRLDGLKPATKYFYRVVTETFDRKTLQQEKGEIRSFRTLAPEAETSAFTCWNDTHKHKETIKKLAPLSKPSDFLVWNGDICNDWYKENEAVDTILTPAEGVDLTAKHPLVVLRGNHDFRGTRAFELEDIHATHDGTPWSAFRSGPIAVICMDTGEDKPDDHKHLFGRVACEPMREEQAAWLKEVIERPEMKDAPYKLVFCHLPLRWINETTDYGYDYYSKRSRDLWHKSLVKWGAQMVISGHTHRDAYLPPKEGFPYAQLVGGGPKENQARVIEGTANMKELTITMKDLSGKETRKHVIKNGA